MDKDTDFHARAFGAGVAIRERLHRELGNRIAVFAQEHDITYIEIYGVLEAVKFELMRDSFLKQEEGGGDGD
jgi:hypothetical protein